MRILTLIEYLILGLAVVGVAFVIGYPLRFLAVRVWGDGWFVPAPVIGVALLQVVTWYWFELDRDGIAVPAIGLTALGGAGTSVILVRRYRSGSRPDWARWRLAGGAVIATAVVMGTNFSYLLTLPRPTSASAGNNDVAAYAMKAAHLLRYGFGDYGAILGDNLGFKTRNDAFGSSAVVSWMSAVLHVSVGRLMLVVIFVFVGLLLYHTAQLILELRPGHEVMALVVAAAACTGVLFIYSVANYFLGQIMAMAVLPLVVIGGMRCAPSMSRRSRIGLMAALAAPFLVMLSHYFHMALMALPVVLPAAALAANEPFSPREAVRRLLRSGASVVSGLLLAIAVVPQWILVGYEQTKLYANAVAGWPLSDYWPVEVMGYLRGLNPSTTPARWAWSLVLVVVFLGAALVIRRAEAALAVWTVGTVALVAVSYVVVIRQYGSSSYREWKWITFFVPLVVAAVLAPLGSAAARLAGRWVSERRREAIGVGVVFTLGVIAWTNPGADPRPEGVPSRVAMRSKPGAELGEEYFDLRSRPEIASRSSVDVALGPFWPTMWAPVMLFDMKVGLLSPSYFSVVKPTTGSMVVPDTPKVSRRGAADLDDTFELIPEYVGPLSTEPGLLDSKLQVLSTAPKPEGGSTVTVSVENTGKNGWILDEEGAGTVHLGGRLEDSAGRVVDENWIHLQLFAPEVMAVSPDALSPMAPGSKFITTLDLPVAPEPGMSVDLRLVSEYVSWFGEQQTTRLP